MIACRKSFTDTLLSLARMDKDTMIRIVVTYVNKNWQNAVITNSYIALCHPKSVSYTHLSLSTFPLLQRQMLQRTEQESPWRMKSCLLYTSKRDLRPSNPWIIHGFRGKAALAEEYLKHGFYLSFGEKYQEAALCRVPADRLFIETDERCV